MTKRKTKPLGEQRNFKAATNIVREIGPHNLIRLCGLAILTQSYGMGGSVTICKKLRDFADSEGVLAFDRWFRETHRIRKRRVVTKKAAKP